MALSEIVKRFRSARCSEILCCAPLLISEEKVSEGRGKAVQLFPNPRIRKVLTSQSNPLPILKVRQAPSGIR